MFMHIHLISDATGAMGEHVLQAVLTQFPPQTFTVQAHAFVNTEARLTACLQRIQHTGGIVVHATVYPALKQRIETTCRALALPAHDLTQPIAAFLGAVSGTHPVPNYQRLHELTPDYFRRVAAIEYTIEHDDGRGLPTLGAADVVLTGPSRTTKTPTSMVLAVRGYRAANVPLVRGVEPPQELVRVPPRRVVCLTAQPATVAAFRQARITTELGHDSGDYADVQAIRAELAAAHRLSGVHGWSELDVTDCAVEETAAHVIRMITASPD